MSAAPTCPVCCFVAVGQLLQLSSKHCIAAQGILLLGLKQSPSWPCRGGAAHEDLQASAQTPQVVQVHAAAPEGEAADVQPAEDADTLSLELQQLLAAVQWQLLRHVEELYWAVVKQSLRGQALNKKV